MLNGVDVDDLTGHFLKIATDRGSGGDHTEILWTFFHDARNRLNSLKIGLHLARRGGTPESGMIWDELDRSYRGLEQLIDRLQTICRPLELVPVMGDLGHWLEERRAYWTSRLGKAGRGLDWAPPVSPAVGWFDPTRLIHGLDALVAWRADEGRATLPARLSWWSDPAGLHVEWSEPGARPSEPIEGGDGHPNSMVLPLLAHILSAHGGSVAIEDRGGLVVRLAWPAERIERGPA
jgi:hypothetical protein